MILAFIPLIRSRAPIRFQIRPLLSSILILSPLFFSSTISLSQPRSDPNFTRETMRIHPLPRKRNNITIRYARDPTREPGKRLRRLPHIFTRVLELPFKSDADVDVKENSDCFKFVAETDGIRGGEEITAHTVEIYPGVTRIVVRTDGSSLGLTSLDELELDVWRFRLPESTIPELVTAVYEGGELIVTVPKVAVREMMSEEEEEDESGEGFGRGMGNGRLVLVQ